MNMERRSSIDKVIGKISDEEKTRILNKTNEWFDIQDIDELASIEKEKTQTEIDIINLVNQATNQMLQDFGMDEFNIPTDNIHIISEENWPEDENNPGAAYYCNNEQLIAVMEQSSKMVLAKKIFHEMIHFKCYNAIQVTDEENPAISDYRNGLVMYGRDGETEYFTSLNEAITERLTMKYLEKLFQNPIFSDEMKHTEKVRKEHGHLPDDDGESLFIDDTFYAKAEYNRIDKLKGLLKIRRDPAINTETYTYSEERNILDALIDKIIQKNPNEDINKDDLFNVFAKSALTGRVMPMVRIIEHTFGPGTFRHIGEMNDDIQKQKEYIESL